MKKIRNLSGETLTIHVPPSDPNQPVSDITIGKGQETLIPIERILESEDVKKYLAECKIEIIDVEI